MTAHRWLTEFSLSDLAGAALAGSAGVAGATTPQHEAYLISCAPSA